MVKTFNCLDEITIDDNFFKKNQQKVKAVYVKFYFNLVII